jgi:hypothetical protein
VAAEQDLADVVAPGRQRLVTGAGDAQLDAPQRLADR